MGVFEHLLWFRDSLRGKASRKKKLVIWLTTCWTLWIKLNMILFKYEVFNIEEVVDNVELFSSFVMLLN